jgi:phage protein U
MYYQLGTIRFEGLQGFNSIDYTEGVNYAEINLVNRKPSLQATNSKLSKFDLSIQFHAEYCIPESEFEKLSKASREREVMPFILGNGIFLGEYVITELSKTLNRLDGSGNIISMVCKMSLLEFVIQDRVQNDLVIARANAFGNDINKGIPGKIVEQPKSTAVEASEQSALIDSTTNVVIETTNQTINNPTAPQSNYNNIIKSCDVISITALELQQNINLIQSKISNYTEIVNNCTAVIGFANSLKDATLINDNVTMQNDSIGLNNANKTLQKSTTKTLLYKVTSRLI